MFIMKLFTKSQKNTKTVKSIGWRILWLNEQELNK